MFPGCHALQLTCAILQAHSALVVKHVPYADEIDAIGTKRYESQSGGEREIQRTMLELLNQMDGFDSMGDVKVTVASAQCTSHLLVPPARQVTYCFPFSFVSSYPEFVLMRLGCYCCLHCPMCSISLC